VPIYALNQVSEERCEWLVPGMLPAKVLALIKSLHQRPRSRLVPLPDYAEEFCASAPFAQGGLVDALLKAVRERTQLAVLRNDFKLETLSPHLWMNFRVVDEHGRQLGSGRNLGALKGDLGAQARGAFQALAGLKTRSLLGAAGADSATGGAGAARAGRGRGWRGASFGQRVCIGPVWRKCRSGWKRRSRRARRQNAGALHQLDLRRTARADGNRQRQANADRFSGAD
jgi:ATP-dependent helicase HrpA